MTYLGILRTSETNLGQQDMHLARDPVEEGGITQGRHQDLFGRRSTNLTISKIFECGWRCYL